MTNSSGATIPRALLDTSVLIAAERGDVERPTVREAAISVVTLAQLHVGVLLARTESVRAQRLHTLVEVERALRVIPFDRGIAIAFAELTSLARRRGRQAGILDTMIAATAIRLGVPVVTRDADFDQIPDLEVIRI